jgi:hypothetical protein
LIALIQQMAGTAETAASAAVVAVYYLGTHLLDHQASHQT